MKLFVCPEGHTAQLHEIDIGEQEEPPVLDDGGTYGGCPDCDHFGKMELYRD